MKVFMRFILPALLAIGAFYLFQPVLNGSFAGTWMLFATLGALVAGSWLLTNDGAEQGSLFGALLLVFGAPLLTGLLVGFFSWGAFHADAYEAQLGAEKDSSFNAALPPIDIRQAPLVSEDMARRSAEKRLSEIPSLGSQVVIGPFEKQIVRGQLQWVAFLEHSGFFRWLDRKTTPGYVTVSATDATDVKLVTEIKGKKLALRYLDSAYFGDEISRHVYFNGHKTLGLSEFIPEIDDDGVPYMVVPLHDNTIGADGSEIASVAVVDVQTGDIKDYDLKNLPAWVDRAQPAAFVKDQIENRGGYVHGWMNMSHQDEFTASDDPDLVFSGGKAYWYQGIRSVGNANAIIGFYLIDSRTKAARKFDLSGTTEEGAKKAAEGVLPEKHYTATNPLPFSVDGRPTFVMALRDGSGIPRAYGMVNVETYQIVAVSDTLQETLRKYQSQLNNGSGRMGVNSQVSQKVLAGKIARIGHVDHGGNTQFFLTLDSETSHIFVLDASVSDKLSLAEKGDSVVVSFEAGDAQVASVTQFEDMSILRQGGKAAGAAEDAESSRATQASSDSNPATRQGLSVVQGAGPVTASATPFAGASPKGASDAIANMAARADLGSTASTPRDGHPATAYVH